MTRPSPARFASLIAALSLIASSVPLASVQAAGPACGDVQVVWARGSGVDVNNDPQFDQFFGLDLTSRIGPGVSVSSYRLGQDNGFGGFKYPAIGDLGSLVGSMYPFFDGAYRSSIDQGRQELVAYLTDRAALCPNEVFVLAGWSQGAQAIGEGINSANLAQAVRDRVAYVALFGDPTLFTGNSVGPLPFPFGCVSSQRPWIRGSIPCYSTGGQLGQRDPYVPAGMELRVGSWCRDGDGVCTGEVQVLGVSVLPGGEHFRYFDRDSDSAMAAREAALALQIFVPQHSSSFDVSWSQFVFGATGADLAIVFDTTGSMSGAIADAKTQATQLAQTWLSFFRNGRVGLVEFKDQGDPFVARVDLGLTNDVNAFQSAVNGLSATGGGDTPEAQLSGVMTALDGLSWADGATKVTIVITDAPGKDPEPVTNFTRSQVSQHALEIDPVAIYGVNVSGGSDVSAFMTALTNATAGQVFVLQSGQSLSDALFSVLDAAHASPVAKLGGPYIAQTGTSIQFSARNSFDASATITSYQWDFDNNGMIDRTTGTPDTAYTYAGQFHGAAAVHVVASDGRSAIATASVTVDNVGLGNLLPIAPTSATAAITGSGEVTITWTPAANDRSGGYKVLETDGTVVGLRLTSDPHSAVVRGLDLSQPIQFRVTATNGYGASAATITPAVGGSAWAHSVVVSTDPTVEGLHALMPAVAIAPNSSALALWARFHTATDFDIYAAFRDPTSGAWSANVRVNDVTTGAQYYPAVAFDQSNNAYAVWVDERNGRRDIYFSKRSSSTGNWSANVRVNSDTTFSDQTTPAIAVSSTGEAIAVWYRKVGTNKYYIYSARLPAGASTWSANVKVTPSQSPERGSPDVAFGPGGVAYAVWTEPRSGNGDIWFSSLSAGSTTWAAATKISDDPGTALQTDAEIGVDANGNVAVVWDDWRTAQHQVRVRRRPVGGAWGASAVISGTTSGSNLPSLSVGSDGRAFATWYDGPYPPTGTTHAWGSLFNVAISSWSTPTRLDDGGASDSASQPAGAIAGIRTGVIWQNATSLQGGGHNNQIWARWMN